MTTSHGGGALRAGLDIGNATTEVVLVDRSGVVVAADRMPTRGSKGTAASLEGAAVLLRRCARSLGGEVPELVGEVMTTAIRPVRTLTTRVAAPSIGTGPLTVLTTGSATVSGRGFGVGVPWDVRTPAPGGLLVAVCPRSVRYADAAYLVRSAREAGAQVLAVVVEADEAVLVGARTGGDLPVVDGVDSASALDADALAVEVVQAGHTLTLTTDAFALGEEFAAARPGSPRAELAHLATVAGSLDGCSNAVVAMLGRHTGSTPSGDAGNAAVRVHAQWEPLADKATEIARSAVGSIDGICLAGVSQDLADLSVLDLAAVAAELRRGPPLRDLLLATLAAAGAAVEPGGELAAMLDVPVRSAPGGIAGEACAARAGAWTTPGARGVTVVDLGAGTCDLVGADPGAGPITAAGCGDLLTVGLARLLGVPRAVAEYAKRAPSLLVDGPSVATGEDGRRHFLDRPAAGDLVGRLAVDGPVGLLALPSHWTPTEWRGVRRRAKAAVVGGAVRRTLAAAGDVAPSAVLLVGGPVADEEVTLAVAEALPPGCAVGRGRVAAGRVRPGARVPGGVHDGSLGHRFAVAYGLTLLEDDA